MKDDGVGGGGDGGVEGWSGSGAAAEEGVRGGSHISSRVKA